MRAYTPATTMHKFQLRLLLPPLLLFLGMSAIGIITLLVMELDKRADERSDLNDFGSVVASTLERQLQRSLSSTFILASLIRQSEDNMIDDFDSVASGIIETYGGIDSLQLAPGGIVSQIYPLEGNERAIGHDLLNDPARRTEALATIESGSLTLAGPFELVQGGTAVIGRLPVFVSDDQGGERFWGFTITLIRLSNLLAATDLAMVAEQGHQYWLSRIHPDTGQRDVFVASTDRELMDSATYNIEVPNGSWALHLRPSNSRSALWFAFKICLVLIFSAIASLLVYTRLERGAGRMIAQQALDLEIKERRRLEAAELQLAKEMSVVDEVARIVTNTLDIDKVYDEFATEVKKLVDFDRMSISSWDRHAGVFTMKHTVGQVVPGQRVGDMVPLEGTPTQVAIDTGRTVLLSDTADGHYTTDQRFLKAGLRSTLLVPLTYRGRGIGGMALRSRNIGAYGLKEQVILERLAHQIAPAVANAELFERSRRAEDAMRQSEAQAKALLESASQGVVIANRDGEIVQINASALDMFGYGRDELLGQRVEMLLPESVRDIHAVQRAAYFTNPVSRPMGLGLELAGRRKDGTCFPAEISLSSIGTDGDTLAMAFVADISERKHAEEAWRRWAEENSVMAEIGRVISSSLEINEVYNRLGEEIWSLIPFDRMVINTFDQEFEFAYQPWVLGTEVPGRQQGVPVPLAGTFAKEVIRRRSPVMLDADEEPELHKRIPGLLPNVRAGMRSFLAIPLIFRDAVVGVIHLSSKEGGVYSQRHLDLAERVGNQIAGAVANSKLYTERVQAEEAMRVSELKYRTLVNESPDMIFVSRIEDFRFTEVNDRACEHYGYTRQQLLAMSIFDIEVEPPLQQEVRSLYDNTPVGRVVEVYGTNKRKDGTTFPVHVRFTKLDDEFAIANVRDITQQKEAEEVRKQWADESLAMAEIGRVISSSLDINEVYENLGEEVRKLIPFDRFSMSVVDDEKETRSPTWALGTGFSSGQTETEVPLGEGLGGEAVRTKSPVLLEAVTEADGESRFISARVYAAGLRSFMAVPLIDRDAVIGVLRVGSKNRGIYTKRHLDLFERIGNQVAGAIANSQLFAERTQAEEELKKAKENLEQTVADRTAQLTASNESLRHEVFERERAEEVLRQQAVAMNSSIDGISIVNERGEFVYVNEAFVRLYGYDRPDELVGKHWDILCPPEELARFELEILPEFLRKGSWQGETTALRLDETKFTQETSMTALEGGGFVCTYKDITERKVAERRLQEASHLASIGELAAGVAHEINNPLTSVLGFSGLMMEQDLPKAIRADLETVHSNAQRAAKVVQNLLSFARKRETEKRYLDMGNIVRRALEMKSYDFKTSNIEVTDELSVDLPLTMVDEHQLIQVMLNVLANAEQAMRAYPGVGQLVIRSASSGDRLTISISDTGPGIPPDHLDKIFDPFFTTRQVGEGIGLGLSISYGIISQHDGDMWAESVLGEGATFHIELPIVVPEKEVEPELAQPGQINFSTKHLLVVDDEPDIRDLLARTLLLDCYTVDLAEEGQEAWRKIQAWSYDCIILDLKMPGTSGQELYRRIEASDKELAKKVVFITGDTISPDTQEFLFATGNPSISKPVDLEELRRRVRESLETTGRPG